MKNNKFKILTENNRLKDYHLKKEKLLKRLENIDTKRNAILKEWSNLQATYKDCF